MTRYYVGQIKPEQWQWVLARYLQLADRFQVLTPDGPGPLSNGLSLFAALPDVQVSPTDRMRDAVLISGELTPQVRDIFTTTQTAIDDNSPENRLWDYQLLRGEVELLSIGDFHDLVLTATAKDLEELEAAGVTVNDEGFE